MKQGSGKCESILQLAFILHTDNEVNAVTDAGSEAVGAIPSISNDAFMHLSTFFESQ